ncbi:OmpA family protein [Pengzhenrongella sicca]|uniref:OmpA family protein n=1 Tax=Pengzhenrongella sicca TaxID=2819238 RepID=A0A8A4ZDB5_9MICO|nr:OmpA family protein [Pengzhenrongella sicca]QTE29970.1 OmpA family protein [Pengzhenrongella sicca]
MSRRAAVVCLAAIATLVLGGCESAGPDDGAGDGAVRAEVEYLGTLVDLVVHPVEVQDGVALLTVDFALAEGAPASASLSIGLILAPATGPKGTGLVRLVDLEAGTVNLPGEDAAGQPATTRDYLTLAPDATVTSQGFYGAPTGDSVAVLFPFFGMVLDVPVVQLAGTDGFATTPAELGREGEITYPSPVLDTFTEGYDDSSSARVEGTAATVALASDVLFAVDDAVLSPAAEQVVVAAAAEISAVAAGGEVSVVGHTDDVASDAYNQDLSVRRAQAVTTVLAAALGSGFPVTPTGAGETQPAVDGASPEARAANRRVEIAFTASDVGAAVEIAGAPAPEPSGPTATGEAAVEVPFADGSFGVSASVVRAGPFLIGSIEVERTSPSAGDFLEFFGTVTQGLAADRHLPMSAMVAGPHRVTLLGTSSRYYPIDYVLEEAESGGGSEVRQILADGFLNVQPEQGQTVLVTVVWPDPGGDTVTIDVPDRFRLLDVPVTSA